MGTYHYTTLIWDEVQSLKVGDEPGFMQVKMKNGDYYRLTTHEVHTMRTRGSIEV